MLPKVSRLRIYPLKSFDHIEVNEITISERCILHDREFALFNNEGKFVNGKRCPEINKLRVDYDLDSYLIHIRHTDSEIISTFSLINETELLNQFFTDYFGFNVYLRQSKYGQFLDIPDISGVSIISEETLKLLSSEFHDISTDELRNRFRVNIEVICNEAYWEDSLFEKPGTVVEYYINDVKLFGISPRARCIVPTRDSQNGMTYSYFTKKFVDIRKKTLPRKSFLNEYEHFYYLSTDTFIPDSEYGKKIKIGDTIRIAGIKDVCETGLNI